LGFAGQHAHCDWVAHERDRAHDHLAMRFEKTIDIDAPQRRVWDVLSDLESWPQRIETVDCVELLTPAPITKGSRVRLKQPKLPEGVGRYRWELQDSGSVQFTALNPDPCGRVDILANATWTRTP
jgi:Polyketide cyclase / dehydrase and lipid transport